MKTRKTKILTLLLATVMLMTLLATTAFAASNENLCKAFQSTVGIAVSGYFGTDLDGIEGEQEKVSVDYLFIPYVLKEMGKDGSLAAYTFKGTDFPTYAVPFSVFEAKAKSIADYAGDLKAMAEKQGVYDSATDCIRFSNSLDGIDQGHPAFVIGYTDDGDNNYTVYVQRMQFGCATVEEVEEEFPDYYEDYDREKDIFLDDNGLYHLVHRNIFYIAKIRYENGSVFYKSLKSADNLDGISMITRDTVINADSNPPKTGGDDPAVVTYKTPSGLIIAGDSAFAPGTAVTVKVLESGAAYDMAKKALAGIAEKFAAFDISAVKDGASVQPNSKVTVTFPVPATLSLNNLKLFYVSADGKTEQIPLTVNQTEKTAVAELSHFSTYALANVATVADTGKSADSTQKEISPKTGDDNCILYALCLLSLVGMAISGIVLKARKEK